MPDAAAGLDELADADAEPAVEVEAELDELLLHPAAIPVQATASRATRGTLLPAKTVIIPRTLPPMVA